MCLAVPGEVLALLPDNMARVQFGQTTIDISLAFVEGVQPGDFVLAHSGFALTLLDKEEAAAQLALWHEVAEKLADGGRAA
jgi:hydrogenase expression/formation protein HypC